MKVLQFVRVNIAEPAQHVLDILMTHWQEDLATTAPTAFSSKWFSSDFKKIKETQNE